MNNPVSLGTATHGAGSITTLAMATTVAVAAGDAILVSAFIDATAGDTFSITDQVGDSFTAIQIANSGSFITVLGYCLSSLGLPSGDSITLTNSAGPQSYTSLTAAKVAGGLAALDKSATATQGAVTALSVGPTAATAQTVELVFVVFGLYASANPDAFTPGTGYTALASAAPAVAFTMIAITEYLVTSATGAQTGTGTMASATNDVASIIATFTGPAAAPAGGRVPTIPKLATIGTP